MRILGISHVGIAAKDPIKARRFFHDLLRLPLLGEEFIPEQKTHALMLSSTDESAKSSGSRLELLTDDPGSDGPIGRFVEKRGGGVHHVALRVEDLASALKELQGAGLRLIDETPRQGAHGARVAFVHPESTGGILVELVQESESPRV